MRRVKLTEWRSDPLTWPGYCVLIDRKQVAWDAEILRAPKSRDESAVLYAARPPTMHANQVPYELSESRMKKNASFTTTSAGQNQMITMLMIACCHII